MILGGALDGETFYNGGLTWQSAAFSIWESLTAIAVCLLLRPLAILPIFKFLLTGVICVPLCFAIEYFVLIRIPGLKMIL